MSTNTKKNRLAKVVKTSAKAIKTKVIAQKPATNSATKTAQKSLRTSAPTPSAPRASQREASSIEALRKDIAGLRATVEKSLSPVASGSMDEVDALRRVLSYLFEAKTEAIIRELVSVRHTAASLPDGGRTVTEPLDALLADLGALMFEAERFEHVDPLIHTITREIQDDKLDDAIIVKTIRPGFRTGRGVVIAKALVTVNRRI